ncbi:hypothetical protein [Roseospirillum parvum]|uniref:Uncharacterized protein n=1 Tax=Roseospirillum parvum TaxID=83401 RepID=A0A1G7YAF5_9PROT|nr:hypothetical protein [Roseospirillum parvum]SDG92980.1 hypothetical protein SAMN05421742_103231 [Roseospirillum parvum]
MAATTSQQRWRAKNRPVKSQLNVMARAQVHGFLTEAAQAFDLKGKAEAVSFAAYLTQGLRQQAEHNPEARRLLDLLAGAYHRDRDMYAP